MVEHHGITDDGWKQIAVETDDPGNSIDVCDVATVYPDDSDADAEWIALVHPGIAEPLAEWLSDAADLLAAHLPIWAGGLERPDGSTSPVTPPDELARMVAGHFGPALRMARVLLGVPDGQ
ncbi:hypothetical protein ABGB07_02165 [Micromonosporaceae bacterium B7E4]